MCVVVGVVGLRLAVVDFASHRLPDRLTKPLFGSVVVIALAWGSVDQLQGALVGSVITGGALAGLACMPGRPLGLGDVKLQCSLGWMLGFFAPELAIVGLAGSFVVGGVAALPALLTHRLSGRDPVPFGPAMVASTCVMVVVAESLKII